MSKYLFLTAIILVLLSCTTNPKLDNNDDVIHYEKPIAFDFSNLKEAQPRDIPGMSSVSSSGEVINVNSNYITKNGEPWIPSYGEFQYQRFPEDQWEDAILKMKSQGFTAVSAYFFWIGHEEEEGKWNFTGRNNIRRFIKLCQKHNLLFFARIGPWVNGEYRNGGHPDWLVKRLGNPENPFGYSGSGGRLRSMDPEYLAAVDKLYQKLAEQMDGLYWKDGGPIFAIQFDNEYTPAHSGIGGTKLIEWEKETALKYGMEVPLYTTTGWNKAEFIQDHTIQTHGSYADYFWAHANDKLRTPAFSFSTLRAVDGIDTEVNYFESNNSVDIEKYTSNPYLTCETGIGMNIAYHRRPMVDYMDNGAVSLVELGSGCNGMGYYMNIGGTNFEGKFSYMNRDMSQTSLDNPVFSNDFQGAIGEFGQIRKSFYEYPIQLNFMSDFGKYLAPCLTYISPETDELRGVDINISTELQRAIRTDGKTGFIFVNNHVKADTSYQFNHVQFEIKLKDETLNIPEKAIDIPIDAYFLWPFNLMLFNAKIKYATAQPILHLNESNTYVFFQNDGIPAEFVFDNANIKNVKANNVKFSKGKGLTKMMVRNAGLNCYFDVEMNDKSSVRFLILNQKQAKQLYKSDDKIYLSDAEVLLFDHNKLKVITERIKNTVWVYPANNVEGVSTLKDGLFDKFIVRFKKVEVPVAYNEIQNGKDITFKNKTAHNNIDGNVGVPVDSIFDKGTIVSISFPNGIPSDIYDVRVKVDYEASALHLYKNDKFIYDDYYNGDEWDFSALFLLKNYSSDTKLELKFIPLQPKDKIHVGGAYWSDLKHKENVLELHSILTVPVFSKSFMLDD